MMALLFLLLGSAEAYTTRICAEWTPDFHEPDIPDDDGLDANGDGDPANDLPDFLGTNQKTALRGLYLTAEHVDLNGAWVIGWEGFAPATGPLAGCTGTFSTAGRLVGDPLRLTAVSVVSVNGNEFAVYDDDRSPLLGFRQSEDLVLATGDGPVTIDMGSGEVTFDVAMAIAFALGREDGGNTSMAYDVYTCEAPRSGDCLDPDAAGAWHSWDDKALYLGDDGQLRVIVHELGHAVAASRMSNASEPWASNHYAWTNDIELLYQTPPQIPDSDCPISDPGPHNLDSDETTGDAIIEAFATYYYAAVTNKTNETDCFVYTRRARDWDHLGATPKESGWYSCEQRPLPVLPSTMNRDYWAHECDNAVDNVSSEYDWVRAFWDLDTDEGLTFGDILDVFVEADPHNWLVTDQAAGLCDVAFPNGMRDFCPWYRMDQAAVGLGIGSEWSNQHDNGIAR